MKVATLKAHDFVGRQVLDARVRVDPTKTRKKFLSGTHRLVAPSATLARVRPLMGVMGITRVANVTGLDYLGIPVIMVCRPNARSLAVSQGKGIDLESARASGLMEAIELYHAERIVLPLKLATWNELRFSHPVIAVENLPRVSGSLFEPNHKVLWVEGTDLISQSPRWLPYEMVHTDFTIPFPTGTGCFVLSSNGLASGNRLIEAIVHGLLEVIERDAATLWVLQAESVQDQRHLDLETVRDAGCRQVLRRYEQAGIAVGVWDTTSDVGIASFLCIAAEPHEPLRSVHAAYGMGCHPTREIALLRALTEAAQSRLTLIAGSRDDAGPRRYARASDVQTVERLRTRIQRECPYRFDDTPTFSSDFFEDDLGLILSNLRRIGICEVIAVDLTKPEFQIPVVRVVVPGLEPYHGIQSYLPGARGRQVIARRTSTSDA